MTQGNNLTIATLLLVFGALVVPAFAQNNASGMQSRPDNGMSMGQMGQSMMGGRGMMSGNTMADCAQMMQSMNRGGNGRPNSQWQQQQPQTPDNGS